MPKARGSPISAKISIPISSPGKLSMREGFVSIGLSLDGLVAKFATRPKECM